MKRMSTGAAEVQEAIAQAWQSIRAHKLRSGLTVLGIVMGVATLISISSVINGLNTNVIAAVEQFGTNVLFINKLHITRLSHPTSEERNRPELTYEDGEAIREVPHVTAASSALRLFHPIFGFGTFTIKSKYGKAGNAPLFGDLPSILEVLSLDLKEGRFINQVDVNYRRLVCALGSDVAEDLFPLGGAVGSEVFVESQAFQVIGVMQKWKSAFTAGKDPNDSVVWIPLSTFRKLHPEHKDFWLYARVDEPENMATVIDSIRDLLRRRRGLRADQEDNFSIMTPDVLTDIWNQISGGFFILMFCVSSVGLLVGGIGVMNIMLVSVTERTQEIGVRKAMGARKRDILWQFVLEAMALTGVGGLLGVLAGAAIAIVINSLPIGLPATLTPLWVAAGFGASTSIGLFFGIYPAWKAAQLDPVVALRYE